MTFTKSFLGDPVAPGGTLTLRYTITNSAVVPRTVLNFTDNLGAALPGLTAVGLPSLSLCGVASVLTGTTQVSLTSGALLPGASCALDVTVQIPASATPGTYASTAGALFNLLLQVAPGATDTLTVAGPPLTPPVFTAAFAPASISLGATARLTYTINNSANAAAATNLTVSNTLPLGLLVAGLPNVSTTCAGTLSAAAGSSSIALVNGSVAAGASCTIGVDIVGLTLGSLVNTSGSLISSLGNSGAAIATLEVVNAIAQAAFSKSFLGDAVAPGATATLRYTITNTGVLPLAALNFTDNLNAALPGLTATGLPDLSLCGAASILAGTSQVSLISGALLPGNTCTFDVTVQVPVSAAAGTYASTSSPLLEAVLQVASGAADSLTVDGAPQTPPIFTGAFTPASITLGATASLTFSIDNTASAADATGLAFANTLPVGLLVALVPNATTTCSGTLAASSGTSSIALSGGSVVAGAACSVSVDVVATAAGSLVNTSGNLTSSLGNSGAATAVLDVTSPAAQASFSKAFIGDPVAPGSTATLRYTITNTALLPLAALNFTDDLDAALPGLTATGLPSLALCGVVSVLSGTSQISLLSGALLPGQTCTLDVTVQVPVGAAAGSYASTSSQLLELSIPVAAPASDTLIIDGVPQTAPTFSALFDPASIALGGTTTITFTIDNSANSTAATGLSFTNSLPLGLVVAATPGVVSTCGGTVNAVAGSTALALTGGSVAAGASCSISVDLSGLALGNLVNTTGNLVSSLGNSGPATALLDVINLVAQASFTKAFLGGPVAPGATATLRYTLTNTALAPLVALNFVDDLDAALPGLAATGLPSISLCGGVSVLAGTSQIALASGALLPGQTCTFDVTVVVPAGAAAGTYTSTSGPLFEAVLQVAAGASDALIVDGPPSGAPLFTASITPATIAIGAAATLTFTIDNGGATTAATALAFNNALPPGLSVTVAGAVNTCGGILVAIPGTALISFSGGSVAAGASCTISVGVTAIASGSFVNTTGDLTSSLGNSGAAFAAFSVEADDARVVEETKSAIRRFMQRRADLITADDPDLTDGLAERGSDMPLRFFADVTPEGTVMQFASGLEQLRGGLAQLQDAYGVEANALRSMARYAVEDKTRAPFDLWIEGAFTAFRDESGEAGGTDGSFGRLYIGGEWRARPRLVLGVMAQFDTMSEDNGDAGEAEVNGNGWMAGPYAAARFGNNVFTQLRVAYGQSDNEISPFGTYEDSFETTRWLVSGKIRGRFVKGAWEISPTFGGLYFREKQLDYEDSNGFNIPSQIVELGRLTFGPEVSYRTTWGSATIQPSLSMVGLYDFLQGDTVGMGDAASDRLRARVTAGLNVSGRDGERLELSGFYDGIGGGGFEAVGGKARVVLPLQRPD